MMQTPHPSRVFSDFHNENIDLLFQKAHKTHKNAGFSAHLKKSTNPQCTIPVHTPVNELHSIEIQALTNSFFLLT